MALILLGLLFLVQSSASVETHSRVCGLDLVGYVKSADGYRLFVNGERVEYNRGLICEVLGFYFGNGCLFSDEEWGRIGKKYCDWESSSRPSAISADSLQMTGRKLLHQLSANISRPDQSRRKDQHEEKTLTPAKVAMAIPGVFLLCCALMCPCFRSKKKEPIEQNMMSTEMDLSESN